jgi:ATP-dependent Lon protease
MKESMSIAQTYVRRLVRNLEPENKELEEGTVHLHVPQGATPKDGPSAGCTAVTALLSLALKTPVVPDIAMTGVLRLIHQQRWIAHADVLVHHCCGAGEISLSGYLLPIGGVKEKALAAKRSGVKTILLPAANRRDWQELSEEVREGLDAKFSKHYLQMIPHLFPALAESHSAQLDSVAMELSLSRD